MLHPSKTLKLLFLLSLIWHPSLFALTLSLNDVLNAALEKHRQANNISRSQTQIEQPTDSWLASPPSVSLLYLHNQQSFAAKEAEISLNLAIKSRLQREIDQQLRSSVPLIKQHALQQQALFLSGLIRSTIWEYKLQYVLIKQVEQKLTILTSLLNHYEQFSKAGNSPAYLTLLVKQETMQSRIALLEHQNQAQALLADYYALTGIVDLPDDINETDKNLSLATVNQHPDIQALDASWQLYTAQLQESSHQSRPWNVSVNAKQIETTGIKENQIGLGLEVPLSMGNKHTQSQYSAFTAAQSQYYLERDKLVQQIQQSISNAKAQLELSNQRQSLLDQALAITLQLQPTLETLLASNTADQEWILRRTLEIVDIQAQFATNQVNLHKNMATLNQAVGKSL